MKWVKAKRRERNTYELDAAGSRHFAQQALVWATGGLAIAGTGNYRIMPAMDSSDGKRCYLRQEVRQTADRPLVQQKVQQQNPPSKIMLPVIPQHNNKYLPRQYTDWKCRACGCFNGSAFTECWCGKERWRQ